MNTDGKIIDEQQEQIQAKISRDHLISKENPFAKLQADNQYYFSEKTGFNPDDQSGTSKSNMSGSHISDFYSIPKLSKVEADAIMREISQDLDQIQTPSKLVESLDKYIVSQAKPKKIIAQAIRNKYRMRMISGELRESMRPSNILVHGRSGSGKTEIFRKIAKLYNAPFISVEATRYTEVGYHGEDITNIIVDLYKKIEYHILKLILGYNTKDKDRFLQKQMQYRNGELDNYQCFILVPGDKNNIQQFTFIKVQDIRKYMYEVYTDELFQLIDLDQYIRTEIEQKGIVFIDELDKLVKSVSLNLAGQFKIQPESSATTKASDEGVQYDLLPILDGTTVQVNPRAGAFEKVKPTDLAIELQGRMPIKAKMETLTKDDFVKILKETEHNLLIQAIELLKIERVNLVFSDDAIEQMAQLSVELNQEDDIGARRLRTVVDAVLEDINFEAPDFEQKDAFILITKDYVEEKVKTQFQNRDFRNYTM
ncbi:heat shock protein atpase subunit [Stylonychia lemnae]|uniref:Heat shock protein atpase subunit n=1 Tax=Stylonychia lemnae TaxID=5949 RepID=A0A078B6A9_STYLE|nr:heat shock protein atpase subunit [Stylonychia lemnae]|eukprot:CDW88847.1 heat shock protein atpase subunit [Stylonychia lemnae]